MLGLLAVTVELPQWVVTFAVIAVLVWLNNRMKAADAERGEGEKVFLRLFKVAVIGALVLPILFILVGMATS